MAYNDKKAAIKWQSKSDFKSSILDSRAIEKASNRTLEAQTKAMEEYRKKSEELVSEIQREKALKQQASLEAARQLTKEREARAIALAKSLEETEIATLGIF